jgi:hypothetical protein
VVLNEQRPSGRCSTSDQMKASRKQMWPRSRQCSGDAALISFNLQERSFDTRRKTYVLPEPT